MSNCSKTHKLVTRTLGSQVTRTWVNLSTGVEETDATVLASLEASITGAECLPQTNTHLIEGCVDVDGSIVAGYTLVDNNGDALFAPRPITDLGFVSCCDGSDGGTGGTEDFGTLANGVIVSDNFQDGNGNATFNLQVRNTTGNATDWTAVVRDVPYATIPSLNAGAYTLATTDNGDGTYTHAFTGTSQLGAYANITITGGLPVPAGTGTASGNPELYI